MSERAPRRKPTSMPRLTHELTRHAPPSSRSAARTSPRLSACLNDSKISRSVGVNSPPLANNSSTCSRSDIRRLLQQYRLDKPLAHARARLLRDGPERQTQVLFEQSHQSHRGLDRSEERRVGKECR